MKKIAYLLIAAFIFAMPAFAQQQAVPPSAESEELARQVVLALPNRDEENQTTQKAFAQIKEMDVSYATRDNPDQADLAKQIVERNFDPSAASYIAAYDAKKIHIFATNFSPEQLTQLLNFYKSSDKSALTNQTQLKLVSVIGGQLAQNWKPFMLTVVHNDINRKLVSDLSGAGLHVPQELRQ